MYHKNESVLIVPGGAIHPGSCPPAEKRRPQMRGLLIAVPWFLLHFIEIDADTKPLFKEPHYATIQELTDPNNLPNDLKSYVNLNQSNGFSVQVFTPNSVGIPILFSGSESISFTFKIENKCVLEYTICFLTDEPPSPSTNDCDYYNECGFNLIVKASDMSDPSETRGNNNNFQNPTDGILTAAGGTPIKIQYNSEQRITIVNGTLFYYGKNIESHRLVCPIQVFESENKEKYAYIRVYGLSESFNNTCEALKFENNIAEVIIPVTSTTPKATTAAEVETTTEEEEGQQTWIWIVLGMVLIILLLVGIITAGYCLFWIQPCKKKGKLSKKKKGMPSPTPQPRQEASSAQLPDSKLMKEEKSAQGAEPLMQVSDMPPTSEMYSKLKLSSEKESPYEGNVGTSSISREKNPYDEILDYAPCPAELKLFDCRTPKEAIKSLRSEIPAINAALEKLGVRIPASGKVEVTPEIRNRVLDTANPILYRNRLWSLEYPLDLTGTFWDRQCKLIDLSLYRLYALLLQNELSEIAGLQVFATLIHTVSKYLHLMRTQKKKYLHPLPFFYDLASKNPSLFESDELAGVWDSAKYRKQQKLQNV